MLEIRSTGSLRSEGKTLRGYAAVFNSEADLGGFVEVIRNGAFRKTLESGSNIRALYHHQGDALLGTTRGGTLQLREDTHGLAFTLALPDTTHGRDLAVLVDRGDVAGCSFGFRVADGGDRWEQRGAQLVRELLSVDLAEITLTSDPAYADTTVALRNRPALVLTDTRRLWLETCE
ncbi:HK97 family phage prohead protease [Xenophilus azovorans]|uniref:HK97 family phage prohead protease n=1 Tax=Xenophilus azovorans TaxID=151755 RepID=UPI000570C5A2|nr:HK97 family phage prohead protease [Xenophilus azovorans]